MQVPPSLRDAWVAATVKWLSGLVAESQIVVVHNNAKGAKLSGLFNIVSYNFMDKV